MWPLLISLAICSFVIQNLFKLLGYDLALVRFHLVSFSVPSKTHPSIYPYRLAFTFSYQFQLWHHLDSLQFQTIQTNGMAHKISIIATEFQPIFPQLLTSFAEPSNFLVVPLASVTPLPKTSLSKNMDMTPSKPLIALASLFRILGRRWYSEHHACPVEPRCVADVVRKLHLSKHTRNRFCIGDMQLPLFHKEVLLAGY